MGYGDRCSLHALGGSERVVGPPAALSVLREPRRRAVHPSLDRPLLSGQASFFPDTQATDRCGAAGAGLRALHRVLFCTLLGALRLSAVSAPRDLKER